ncbi:MAG: carboxypeptidase-like regulatory domain-containing protein, partial [Gemmatimonadaceae bacterium]
MSKLIAWLCLAVVSSAAGAQRPQTIRGRVTTDSGVAIPAADIIVTVAPTTESISGKSDSTGAYRIVVPRPTGEYILYIGAVGRKAFRQRVTIAANDSEAVVNAKLGSAVTTVAAVQVQARHARPPRSLSGDNGFGTNAGDKSASDGVNAALSPDLQGNLDALATFIPGLALGPNGLSAFGMGSDANSTTLNGLAFGGSDFPRDARVATRFRSSVWDPTVGGFAGVQTAATLSSGGNVANRRGHVTLDAPSLQFSDPVAARLGQKFTNLSLDEGGSGPYRLDKVFYNFGAHLNRNTSSISSLADLDADALAAAGISPDSAARALGVLNGLHI